MSDFSKRAFQFYTQKGYAPHQAAALAGNADWESSGNPTIEDPRGEGSVGLFQWRLGRRAGLTDFAKERGLDPKDEKTQLEYADWELNNTEKPHGDALRSSADLTGATNAVMGFLRPQGYTPDNPLAGHGYTNRYNNGAELINAPNMATALAMPPPQNVATAPDWQMYQKPVPTPPVAPADTPIGMKGLLTARTDPYADTSGLRQGMSLLAAGQGQPTWTPPQPSLLAPHRGEDVPLNYLRNRLGLLG